MKRIFFFFVSFLIILALVILSGIFFFKFESNPPQIIKASIPHFLGKKVSLDFYIKDQRSGLRSIRIFLFQGEKKELIFEQRFPVHWLWGSKVKEKNIKLNLDLLKKGFKDGKAELWVEVRDAAWRNGLKGNVFWAQKKLVLDLTPPKIGVLSPLQYLVLGGTGFVIYRLSEPCKKHFISIDNLTFKSFPLKGEKEIFVSLIALPLTKKKISHFFIEAEDQAGNKAKLSIPYYLKKKKYRRDTIVITDRFLKKKIPEFWARYEKIPRDNLLKAFLWINTEMRKQNNEEISSLTKISKVSSFYVKKALLRLPHSATRAKFGDQRTYYYHHRRISHAIHLGIDLASVAGTPVPAAAEGQVVFADYLGIYGNTIIIDHGWGLFSLYAHLAGFNVSAGEHVKRGQLLGYTDTTGLAGGDHLHFGVLVQGIFVEPLEWFDPHWVKSRIWDKLKLLGFTP